MVCEGAKAPYTIKKINFSKIKLAFTFILAYSLPAPTAVSAPASSTGQVSEWSKEHDWKSCVRQKRTEGSNPSLSAKSLRLKES